MTIGERIKEKAEGEPNTTPDWYANELYIELSDVAEVVFQRLENSVSSHTLHHSQRNILSMIVDHLFM